MVNSPFDLHAAVYDGDLQKVRSEIENGVSVDHKHWTGMTALQLAVGLDRIEIAEYLISVGSSFHPDPEGRMPTIIAIECKVSDAMQDLITDAEIEFLSNAATSKDGNTNTRIA